MTESRVCAQGGTDEPKGRNEQPGRLTGREWLVTGRTRSLRGITRDRSQARATVVLDDIQQGRVWGLTQILSAKGLPVKVRALFVDDSTSVAAIFGDVIRRHNHCGLPIPLRHVRRYVMASTGRKPRQNLHQGAARGGRCDPARRGAWAIFETTSRPLCHPLSSCPCRPRSRDPLAAFRSAPIELHCLRSLWSRPFHYRCHGTWASYVSAPHCALMTGRDLKWRATGTGICRRYE